MRITRALLVIMSGAAVLWWYVVVAMAVQEVTAMNCVACGGVVSRRVVFIALVIKEILADTCRVVATVNRATAEILDMWLLPEAYLQTVISNNIEYNYVSTISLSLQLYRSISLLAR